MPTDIIQLLPDSVANQIAAGEVIQRPASVIKELVENSVDAGATAIHVLVVDAGRTSIQVIDNGKGMSETDARLSFERHATSKIRKADDLFALHTMGFRGEALASIAAVAQVDLRTRRTDDELGTHLAVAASKVVAQETVSCPVGSNFKVENLFFNVPARRKFLKTNATELTNIITAFNRIVLVYPDISFTLHSNGEELLSLKAGSLRQRISDVFGRHISQELLPVQVDTRLCRITGFVGKPETARTKGAHTYFFVNGRYMRHAYFHKAVLNAYERMLPEGMQVPYFLYFTVAPEDIDVNIHPTKTEIKFENEQAIWQILSAATKDAIGQFCEVPAIDFDTEGRPDIPIFDPVRDAVQTPAVNYNPDYNPFKSDRPAPVKTTVEPPSFDFADQPADAAAPVLLEDKSPMHYQYKGRYIMTAVKSGLMVIDQHRADLRILYERYLERISQRAFTTQGVLFPETVTFSVAEALLVQRLMPQLVAMGFDLSDLGGGCYAVNGIPAGVDGVDPVSLVTALVSDAVEKGQLDGAELNAAMALSLARTSAIVYGQSLGGDEMERIVNELFACSNVNYTPDGKPIIAILPHRDIEQLFGAIPE